MAKKTKKQNKMVAKKVSSNKKVAAKKTKSLSSGNKLIPIQPLGDRVLIREIGEEPMERTTATGIIIPESAEKDSGGKKGIVVAAGNGKIDDGKRIPVDLEIGATVLYQWGDKVTINNEEYTIVRESEIIAVLN